MFLEDEVPTSDYPGQRCTFFGTHNTQTYPRAEVAEKCLEACKAKPGCAFSSFKYNKDATNIHCYHSTAQQCKLIKANAWDNFVVHSVAKANDEEEPAKEEEKEEEKPKGKSFNPFSALYVLMVDLINQFKATCKKLENYKLILCFQKSPRERLTATRAFSLTERSACSIGTKRWCHDRMLSISAVRSARREQAIVNPTVISMDAPTPFS